MPSSIAVPARSPTRSGRMFRRWFTNDMNASRPSRPDHDVLAGREPRDAVRRRVGLDRPPVVLGIESRDHLVERLEPGVDPRRDHRDRPLQTPGREEQRGHDRLHPGGAALRWGAHEDVPGPVGERLPAVVVGDDAAVITGHGGQCNPGPASAAMRSALRGPGDVAALERDRRRDHEHGGVERRRSPARGAGRG